MQLDGIIPEPHEKGASAPLFLSGTAERLLYHDLETGECLIDVKLHRKDGRALIAGHVASLYPGQDVEIRLRLSPEKESLQQKIHSHTPLRAEKIKPGPPSSSRAVKKFLKSGALPGLPVSLATALSLAYPRDLFTALDRNDGGLLSVPGVGAKRHSQIINAWKEYVFLRSLRQFLFEQKLPLSWAQSLWFSLGFEAMDQLRREPYRTAREEGLDFELIDAFALREGAVPESMERVRAGLHDTLLNFYKQGHCAYPEDSLLEAAVLRLNVAPALMEDALELELLEETFMADTIGGRPCIYLKKTWALEKKVAERLLTFERRTPPWGWFNTAKVLDWAQTLFDIKLAPLQKEAIEIALSSSLTVITGGPGTGKTTLLRSLVKILQTQSSQFALCSPTGRGAQRLSEATGASAQTIHRLLKYDGATGRFAFNSERPLAVDLVLVDEVSMVDLALMARLLEALPEHAALVLVGDADQLPPVGAGNILQSLIDSRRFATVKLTDIFRQSTDSLIKINARRINAGEMPITSHDKAADFHFLPVHNGEEARRRVIELVTKHIPEKYGIKDSYEVQVLVPLNRGPLGTHQLNLELQACMSVQHHDADQESIGDFGPGFKAGDKIMVLKNDYKKNVFNGDVGFIRRINHDLQLLEVDIDGQGVDFGFDELDKLTLAYAISIHKSQGSEYRAVVVVITAEHLPMAQRHLIYTAVTRGKEQVFLVAEPAALQTAILSDENNRRWQKLTELLQA